MSQTETGSTVSADRVVVVQSGGGALSIHSYGGGVRHMVAVCSSWRRQGVHVELVTNDSDLGRYDGFPSESVTRLPTLVSRVRPGDNVSYLLTNLMNFTVQRKMLRKVGVRLRSSTGKTVVLAASSSLTDIVSGVWLSRALKAPVCVYFHHVAPRPVLIGGDLWSLFRSAVNQMLAALALALCKVTGAYIGLNFPATLADAGWRVDSVVVKTEGITEAREKPVPPEQYRPRCAAFVGRLTPAKGVIDLVDVLEIISRAVPGARFSVVGRQSSRRFIHKIETKVSKQLPRGSFELLGEVSDDEKSQVLGSAKLFIFPSYEEGWGLVVAEAVMSGCYPVIYDLPAYGYLGSELPRAELGDTHSLAEIALRALSDEPYRVALVRSLQSSLEKYGESEVAKRELSQLGRLPAP